MLTAVYIVGFIASSTGASLLFKLAANEPTLSRAMVIKFVLGNLAGVLAPFFMTLALRGTQANVVMAICYGASFCALQVALTLLFRETLSPFQWTGIATVAAGILLLHVR